MPIVDRGTHRLHYDVHGAPGAPPLLLVMGLSFSSRAWHTLPERLAETSRVITFDNAGSGRSTSPWRLRIPSMADDAAAVLDAAGIDRAVVFGISMGGMISIELALRHPDRIEGLILGATHGGYRQSAKPSVRSLGALGMAVMFRGLVPPRRLAHYLTSEAHYAADEAKFLDWYAVTDPAHPLRAARQVAAIARHAADERLSQIRAPTLVISGDRDTLVPVENSRRLAAAIPGARLVELPGVGHCFPVEREDEVVELMARFRADLRPLQRSGSAPPSSTVTG